jgi:3'-5' exoribonuclease
MKIKDLKANSAVEGQYLASKKDVAMSKAGKPYLVSRLMDNTGEVEARGWENAELLATKFDLDDVVRVKGSVAEYQGALQINVSAIERVKDGSYSLRDFLPSSKRDPDEMMAELDGVIASMRDADLRTLFERLFKPGSDTRELFKTAPAAKGMHHAYLGGLAEHVLSVCKMAELAASHYRQLDRDMLIAGVFLHDIGKIYELSYKRSFDYTDHGRLVGHITIGVGIVDEAIRSIKGFPESKAVLLRHMILSHHGLLEYGSPKRPKTPEAFVLSALDDLDAKLEALQRLISGDKSSANWTQYSKQLERYIFKGFADAAPQDAEPEKPAPSTASTKKSELDLF